MDYRFVEQCKQKLRAELKPKRYDHTMRTLLKAMELCEGTDADHEVVFWAALLHDCAKYRTPSSAQALLLNSFLGFDKIIHAPLGAILAREEYGIDDERVLNAIRYHATGCENMALEEKIVFLADAIEDGRDYPGVGSIREATMKNGIDAGVLTSLRGVIEHEKQHLHPLTLAAATYLEKELQ